MSGRLRERSGSMGEEQFAILRTIGRASFPWRNTCQVILLNRLEKRLRGLSRQEKGEKRDAGGLIVREKIRTSTPTSLTIVRSVTYNTFKSAHVTLVIRTCQKYL